MQIETKQLSELNPAAYNPRKDLSPDDPEYQKLKKSILEFGLVEIIVWNKLSGNIVGGHQRYKILSELGHTETQVVVVELSAKKEKALNIALNKIGGDWDFPKLKDLLVEIDTGEFDIELTGWSQGELEETFGIIGDQDIDITPISQADVNLATNFIIKCADLNELALVKSKLGIDSQKISGERFLAFLESGSMPPASNKESVIKYYLSFLPPKGTGSILDIGCGKHAPYKGILSNRCSKYTGFDIKAGSKVDVVGSVLDMPFDGLEYDWGWCCETLEHIDPEYQQTALKEIQRVCRNAVITFPTPKHESFHGDPTHIEVIADFEGWTNKSTKTGRGIFILERGNA